MTEITKQMDINENLLKFFASSKKIHYDKHEIIIHEDEQPSGIYFLIDGFVKMASSFESGSDLTVNIFKPNSFFPMIWAITDSPNNYYYETLTPVNIYRKSKSEVLEFLHANPEIYFDLTKRILIGMDGLLVNMQHLLYGNSLSRLSSAFYVLYKRFGHDLNNGEIKIDLPLTHQEVANIAGVTRETASLTIEKMVKQGIIKRIGKYYVIVDLPKLEELTNLSNMAS